MTPTLLWIPFIFENGNATVCNQRRRVWRRLLAAARTLKVTVLLSSLETSQIVAGWKRPNLYRWREPVHLASGGDAAKSFNYSMLPHLGEWGHCTVSSASANPAMIKNVYVSKGQLFSVPSRNGGGLPSNTWLSINQHQPKQNLFFFTAIKQIPVPLLRWWAYCSIWVIFDCRAA